MTNRNRDKHRLFETERLHLRWPAGERAGELLDFEQRNREFFAPWEPDRGADFYTLGYQRDLIERSIEGNLKGRMLKLFFSLKGEKKIIGACEISNIVYGPFLSGFLGYKQDINAIGHGYMTEGVRELIEVAFSDLGLHRIEANVMPRNYASISLLERLGFENEGLSRAYLKIAGVWEDHLHFVRLNPNV